jgi:hypothetical protein
VYVHYRPCVYSGPSEGNLIVLNASFLALFQEESGPLGA